MGEYILGIDQSTSGTKAVIFDSGGRIIGRSDKAHEQKISSSGWVSHDPMEIYESMLQAVSDVIAKTQIDKANIKAAAISNQRETALVWDKSIGLPVNDAVVWQCGRAADICKKLEAMSAEIKAKTGLPLSPFFSAAKIAWILENSDVAGKTLCAGTIDSWLIFKLTGNHKTDYSNASRTQLLNLSTLEWDRNICAAFGIDVSVLPEICDSNSEFGSSDFDGIFDKKIPILAVMGDSHGALYGQGCFEKGMVKATYGTGSSVMMNIGDSPVFSDNGLATSLAWGIDGKVSYVLEGNINYTGSVIKWLVDDVKLIESSKESGEIAATANRDDTTYLVPAFTGLGAPYWKSDAKAMLYGMSRKTGRAEIIKAAEECIAYQIADILKLMQEEVDFPIKELRADGGPTNDAFLMQFQSNILDIRLSVPTVEELSVTGAAYMAGIKACLYSESIGETLERITFSPAMDESERKRKYNGWKEAVEVLLLK